MLVIFMQKGGVFIAWLRNPTPIKICEGKSEDSNYSVCCMRSLHADHKRSMLDPSNITRRLDKKGVRHFASESSVFHRSNHRKVDGSEIWRSPVHVVNDPIFYMVSYMSGGCFRKIGIPQNGWFIMENPFKIDDLGVSLFSETSRC